MTDTLGTSLDDRAPLPPETPAALRRELDTLNEPQRSTFARSLIPALLDLGPAEAQEYRDVIAAATKVTKRDFDAIATHERKLRIEQQKLEAAEKRAAVLAAARASTRCLPSPGDPLKVARAVLQHVTHSDDMPHIAWWRGDWYQWTGSHWTEWADSAVDEYLYGMTEEATYIADERVERWSPNRDKIGNLAHALGRGAVQRDPQTDPDKVVSCTNGVVDLRSEMLFPHTPKRFNLHSLPYAYDPDATCPQWLAFLKSVLPDQEDAWLFLQEWFGYIVSGRTDLHKIASLVGPPRCGKGTIARVLEALLGSDSVASPTMDKMASQFGEQGLIGKTLAVLADVRWNARAVSEAVPVLLAISGEDARDVPRKNRVDWHGRLDVRFMLMSNDTPTFNDASGALAVRMVHIHFTESFLGREDTTLTERLLTELPGILAWALDGLRSLTERGHFLPPASGIELHEEVLRISSPVSAFVEDRCRLDKDEEEDLDGLYQQFENWSKAAGYNTIPLKEIFSRNLQSAFRGKVRVIRKMVAGERRRIFVGIRCEQRAAIATADWLIGR